MFFAFREKRFYETGTYWPTSDWMKNVAGVGILINHVFSHSRNFGGNDHYFVPANVHIRITSVLSVGFLVLDPQKYAKSMI